MLAEFMLTTIIVPRIPASRQTSILEISVASHVKPCWHVVFPTTLGRDPDLHFAVLFLHQ